MAVRSNEMKEEFPVPTIISHINSSYPDFHGDVPLTAKAYHYRVQYQIYTNIFLYSRL